jgi:hypothetical protein
MTNQNYLQIESNVVTNLVLWDGDTNTWQPPADATMLVQATTPAMVWELNNATPPVYVLTEEIGVGQIGFTWDGSVLITNQQQPPNPPNAEIASTGTKTA